MSIGFDLRVSIKRFVKKISKGEFLFFPCSETKRFVLKKQLDVLSNYFSIKTKPELLEVGHALLEAGFTTDFKKLKAKNLGFIDGKVLTNCARCLHVLRKYYKVEAYHYVDVLKHLNIEVNLNNACLLADTDDIAQNLHVKTMRFLTSKGVELQFLESFGSEGLLLEVYPAIAKSLLLKSLKKCDKQNIVTVNPRLFNALKAIVKDKNLKFKVKDLCQVLY